MDKDNVLFYKNGRKYVPVGYYFDKNYLTDGIWYVRSNGTHITNGDYLTGMFKISDKPLFDNFKDYCDLDDVAEAVLNDPDFHEFLKNTQNGWSISDIVHLTIGVLKKKSQNNENNNI